MAKVFLSEFIAEDFGKEIQELKGLAASLGSAILTLDELDLIPNTPMWRETVEQATKAILSEDDPCDS